METFKYSACNKEKKKKRKRKKKEEKEEKKHPLSSYKTTLKQKLNGEKR